MSWLFAAPYWGYAALLLPVWAWLWWRARARAERGRRMAWPRHHAGRRRFTGLAAFSWALGFLALVALACAPVDREAGSEPPVAGARLVIALDLSRSMAARDLRPDRATRARIEIAGLLDALEGERVGLVGFAGDAVLLVPLTRDADAVLMRAQRASPADTRAGGTDLGVAIRRALQALGDASAGGHILLLTDGEDRGERGRTAAAEAAKAGALVHAIGVATAFGARIPVTGARGEAWLLDQPGGQPVLTSLDEDALRALAAAGSGEALMLGEVEGQLAQWWRSGPGSGGRAASAPEAEGEGGVGSVAADLKRALMLLAGVALVLCAGLSAWRGRGLGR